MKQAHRVGVGFAAIGVFGLAATAQAIQPAVAHPPVTQNSVTQNSVTQNPVTQNPVTQPVDQRLPYRNLLPSGNELNVRVVDGRTGKPIAGATVYTVAERKDPDRGQYWSDNQARANQDGFVRIRRPAGYWIVVEAQGYAVTAWSGKAPGRDGVLTMYPGLDVPVQLRNFLGELQPGAGLGFCVGCGHSPDVRFAIAGADGIAWLRDIGRARGDDDAVGIGDLYPLGSGLDGDYDGLDPWFVGGAPVQRFCAGAPDLAGTVIEADGEPAKNVVVRQFERHRGPATKTDKEGKFRIVSPFNGSRWAAVTRRNYPGSGRLCLRPRRSPCNYRPWAAPSSRPSRPWCQCPSAFSTLGLASPSRTCGSRPDHWSVAKSPWSPRRRTTKDG